MNDESGKRSYLDVESDLYQRSNAVRHFGKYILFAVKSRSAKWKVTFIGGQNLLVALESVKIDIKQPFQLNDYI
ncbi:hypothetical protein C0T31_00320 [Dysgonamonadaceae bacterium]|nr:hypothetical protein C0T31_00320 [Dysgonamonadaceae bacterium]